MFRRLLLHLTLGLLVASAAHAQTLDEVLKKHFDALGGVEKLKTVQSRKATGTMAMGQGMEAPFTLEQKRPSKQRIEFNVQGMVGVQAFDGEKSWTLFPFMGQKNAEYASEEDSKNMRDDSDFDGPLMDYKTKGHTVELVGKEPVEGAEAYKLKVTLKSGNVQYVFLDAETFLLVKQEAKVKRRGTEIDGETYFSDYKEVGGFMEPHVVEQGAKGMEQRQKMTFSKIEHNVALDDNRFTLPAPADTTKAAAAPATTDKAAAEKAAADKAATAKKKK